LDGAGARRPVPVTVEIWYGACALRSEADKAHKTRHTPNNLLIVIGVFLITHHRGRKRTLVANVRCVKKKIRTMLICFRSFMVKHQYKVMRVSLVAGIVLIEISRLLTTSWFLSRLSPDSLMVPVPQPKVALPRRD